MAEQISLRISETPRTLRELALERLRSAIYEARFRPGERLTERDLGEQLGVSRTVVREVIRHLESEGLVQIIPNQGPIVAKLDAATAAEIYELRGLLESAAAYAAAKAADKARAATMAKALQGIRDAYKARNFSAVLSETTRFYEAMFLAGGKHVAWEIVQRLNGRISMLRAMTISSTGRQLSGPVQMQKILDAITTGKAAVAADSCRDHVQSAAAIAARLLNQGNG